MKVCSKCGIEKPLAEYPIRRASRDGHHPRCKLCVKKDKAAQYKKHKKEIQRKAAERYRENPAKAAARVTEWNKQNKSRRDEIRRRWAANNPKKDHEAKRHWARNNRAYCAAKDAARRARKLRATPVWANHKAIVEIYKRARQRTESGIECHVDHIVPLKHPLVCGLHVEHNLRVIPAALNTAKNNHYWPNMPEAIDAGV